MREREGDPQVQRPWGASVPGMGRNSRDTRVDGGEWARGEYTRNEVQRVGRGQVRRSEQGGCGRGPESRGQTGLDTGLDKAA